MYEDAYEIFEYLPIRVNKSEDEYIKHLWDAFVSLDSSDGPGRSFSIMAFHLLYMLALQYKLIRVAIQLPDEYNLAFTAYTSRNKLSIIDPQSVFDIALISERTIPDILGVIGIREDVISNAKKLIDNRNNNLAHAKGGIEVYPESKIAEYLDSLRSIQTGMGNMNHLIVENWSVKIKDNNIQESELANFIESQLLHSKLCPADFRYGSLKISYPKYLEKI